MVSYLVYPNTATGAAVNEQLVREDVSDLVSNLFPLDTPAQQILERRPMNNVFCEYPVDTFTGITRTMTPLGATAGGTTTYARPEGATYTDVTALYPARLKSVAEIQGVQYSVSDTDRAMSMYGIADRYNYEGLKQTQVVVNNFEMSFWWSAGSPPSGNDIDSGGGTVAARQTQGIMQWILKSGLERSRIGSYPGACSDQATFADGHGNNFGTTAPSVGTSAGSHAYNANGSALDAGMFKDQLMAKLYALTGRQAGLMGFASPRVKNLFSQFALSVNGQINERTIEAASKRVVDTVDWYETDYGVISLNMCRYLALPTTTSISQGSGSTTVALDECLALINPAYFKIGVVRGVTFSPLAKTGDFESALIRGEQALICLNPQAHGAIVNCIP